MEKTKVTLDRGGEMSLMYGVPDEFAGDPACLVFAHGAGGPMYSPFLTYFHTELAKHGFLTIKFNFPYMEARKKTPDKKDVLEAAYRKIVEASTSLTVFLSAENPWAAGSRPRSWPAASMSTDFSSWDTRCIHPEGLTACVTSTFTR